MIKVNSNNLRERDWELLNYVQNIFDEPFFIEGLAVEKEGNWESKQNLDLSKMLVLDFLFTDWSTLFS